MKSLTRKYLISTVILSVAGPFSLPSAFAAAPPATSPVATIPSFTASTGWSSAVDQLIPKINVDATSITPGKTVSEKPRPNDFWFPTLLDLSALRRYESVNPLGANFDYAKAFSKLDLNAVKTDLRKLLTTSQAWWPADYGNYGPFFIRLAWHSAGTYRAVDGRGGADGGQQRFEPLSSWPDNVNLDKARRLLQPLVDKYYPNLSWADAMVLAGDEALRSMGFQTLGFAGGRADDWTPDLVYWGPEDKFLESNRFDSSGHLMLPLAASVMGLIYVNPEGPDGKPDPLASADRIRTAFGRMGMNDEETVALIAGGHTFGKAHGAHKPDDCLTPPVPANASVQDQQIGWHNKCGKGNAEDTISSGLEGSWSAHPTEWTLEYLTNLFKYDWKLQKGPGGKYQWYAENLPAANRAPNAHGPGTAPIMMFTTDLALKFDPAYLAISSRYLKNPDEFKSQFAKAWFKLIHRDLGPKTRYLGKDFPKTDFIWQDPVPAANYVSITAKDIQKLKTDIRNSGISEANLIKTAWAGAATYRGTDMKGGLNGARLRLAPQNKWEVNEPELLSKNLTALETIQTRFNKANAGKNKKVSLADLIVLAGNVGVEQGALKAGVKLEVPFSAGRTDATQDQTDVNSFANLKVTHDGFRNYYSTDDNYLTPAASFVDRADLLTLTVPEMAVLTGGLRVLGANYGDSKNGVFTQTPGTLTNDFFVNLLDSSTVWTLANNQDGTFVGKDRQTGKEKWTATTFDLIFGSSSELRVVAAAYASPYEKAKFVQDFVKAWTKVMNLDRFDLKKH